MHLRRRAIENVDVVAESDNIRDDPIAICLTKGCNVQHKTYLLGLFFIEISPCS